MIENAEFSLDNETQGSIQTARIYPSIFYLVTGRLVVHQAVLERPRFKSRLPVNSKTPFDVEELEKQIRSALLAFTSAMPAPRIEVSDGFAEIQITGNPPVILDNVTAHAAGSPAELRFELSARSNLCDRFTIEGKVSPKDLASRLDIEIQRLKIKESVVLLPLHITEYALQGELSLGVKITSVGLREVKASIDGSTGSLVLVRNGRTATIVAKRLNGDVAYKDGTVQLDVERLNLESPRLQASGELKSQDGLMSAQMKIRDVDIAETVASCC
jgi:hypothetical protein